MKDLVRAKVQHNGLQQWLDWGKESLMLSAGEKNIALLLRFDKQPGISYLYAFSPLWQNTVSWDDSPEFAGVYTSGQRLFLTKDALGDFMEHWAEPFSEGQPYMSVEISGEINRYIESIIQNNREVLLIFVLAIALAASGFWMVHRFIDSREKQEDFRELAESVLLEGTASAPTPEPFTFPFLDSILPGQKEEQAEIPS